MAERYSKDIKLETYTKYYKHTIRKRSPIAWTNKDNAYQQLTEACSNDSNIEDLAMMLLGGSPYIHQPQGNISIIERCAKLTRIDLIDHIIKRHEIEKTSENDLIFKKQCAKALKELARTNNRILTKKLLEVGAEEESIDLAAITLFGGWEVLDEIFTFFKEVNINGVDKSGNTLLHHASSEGQAATIRFLIEKGADTNILNKYDETPLQLACKNTHNEIALSILIENSDLTLSNKEGRSPAILLAERGKDNLLNLLAELGVNFDDRAENGDLPLIVAAEQGHTATVKVLIANGATYTSNDIQGFTALDKAMDKKRDETSAMLIRLDPDINCIENFFSKYGNEFVINLIKNERKETIHALLDRSAFDPIGGSGMHKSIYMELGYWQNRVILHRLAKWGNKEIAYHGTIRQVVDHRMKAYGKKVLIFRLTHYIIFLMALSYSLIQASTERFPRDSSQNGAFNILRIITELFVFIYFIFDWISQGVIFYSILRDTKKYLQSKTNTSYRYRRPNKQVIGAKIYNFFIIRAIIEYFRHKSNIFNFLGLMSLLLLMLLRASSQPVQWVFATITFFINALRIFKLIVLIPHLGPYSSTIFEILINDVPLFSSLFFITLLIFTGGYYISLRTPYTSQGLINASLVQNTTRISGIDNEVQWVFLSGIRILLEGNVYENDYLYRQLNWLSAVIYLTFLFLTVVVFLNVFIAQLSERYAFVKEKANQLHALQLLKFIVQVDRTSFFSLCYDFEEKFFIGQINISRELMHKYYHVKNANNLITREINKASGDIHFPMQQQHLKSTPISHNIETVENENNQKAREEKDYFQRNEEMIKEIGRKQESLEFKMEQMEQRMNERLESLIELVKASKRDISTVVQEL